VEKRAAVADNRSREGAFIVAHLRGKKWGDDSHMGAQRGSALGARVRMRCSGAGRQR
jgi:hypothetical protein